MQVQTSELSASQKAALEELMGRKLLDEESIRIHAFTESERSLAERQAAKDKLREFLESPRPRPGVSDEEMEAAILEAMRSVRPGYSEVR